MAYYFIICFLLHVIWESVTPWCLILNIVLSILTLSPKNSIFIFHIIHRSLLAWESIYDPLLFSLTLLFKMPFYESQAQICISKSSPYPYTSTKINVSYVTSVHIFLAPIVRIIARMYLLNSYCVCPLITINQTTSSTEIISL